MLSFLSFSQFFTILHNFSFSFSFLLWLWCGSGGLLQIQFVQSPQTPSGFWIELFPLIGGPAKQAENGGGGGSCASAWAKWLLLRLRDREMDGRKLLWQLLVRSRDLESTLQLKSRRLSTLDSTLQMGLMGSTQLDSTRLGSESWSCKRKANANANAAFSCNYVADIKMKFPAKAAFP